jgi:hypothetical protein
MCTKLINLGVATKDLLTEGETRYSIALIEDVLR